MKVPTRRWGNSHYLGYGGGATLSLNESPRPKAGKSEGRESWSAHRKGLNESPRPKVEKSDGWYAVDSCAGWASMKVPRPKAGKCECH